MVHQHRAGFVVHFGVDARFADEVDDPLFAFLLREGEAGGEVSVSGANQCQQVLRGLFGGIEGTYLISIL